MINPRMQLTNRICLYLYVRIGTVPDSCHFLCNTDILVRFSSLIQQHSPDFPCHAVQAYRWPIFGLCHCFYYFLRIYNRRLRKFSGILQAFPTSMIRFIYLFFGFFLFQKTYFYQ